MTMTVAGGADPLEEVDPVAWASLLEDMFAEVATSTFVSSHLSCSREGHVKYVYWHARIGLWKDRSTVYRQMRQIRQHLA
jgi:hypothetical protein